MKALPYAYARKNVVECGISETLPSVAKKMRDEGVGSLIVKDESGGYAGMLTDSLIFCAIADGKNVSEMKVSDLHLMPFAKASRDADFGEVMDLFAKHNVSRLALTDEKGKIVAVLKKKNIERFAYFNMASKLSPLKP